jgi:uncharacterized protein (DUF58 family)
MNSAVAETLNESVRVSVPMLVRLNRSIGGITLHTTRILARQGGDYLSPFKGRGMEFDESRLYQPGDDIRNLDWRVTARTGKPHTKLFREERERPVFVWVDLRRPMFFATRGCFKAVQAAKLAGLLAWSANQHGDRVGGVIFSEAAHHELKPQRGKTGVLRLINRLVQHPAWRERARGGTEGGDCGKALTRLRRVARPGSLIFLISDFRQLDDPALSQINVLGGSNELVLILVHDLLEQALPAVGYYRITDGDEELLVDTHDRDRVERYRRRYAAHVERLRQLARLHRGRLLICSTTDNPAAVLQQGL